MLITLPDEPNLEYLRNQAKDLRRKFSAGDPEVLAEVAALDPAGPPDAARVGSFRLSDAQLIVARRYGFASWARLRRHVELVGRYSRFPVRMAATDNTDLADRFLRLACLTYEDDQPERWVRARQILVEHPEITEGNVYVAAVAADLPALRRILETDPSAAQREGGPYRWEPLFHLAYARHDPGIDKRAVLACAHLLLDAGADPNAGYLWHGMLSPFTVLTGVFGEGELGPLRQPRHPHSLALGRVLLERGADANDSQTLYNRMFEPGNDHLELLFEFGLGTGKPGPWRRRLGHTIETPSDMVRGQLAWAITHGMDERMRLLVEHGVDVVSPLGNGLSPTATAATTGHPELIDYLVAHGAPRPQLSPTKRLVAAALASDRATVEQLRLGRPDLLKRVRSTRPALVVWAAASGHPGAVELLVELGFDVNAKGRSDVPLDQPWETALHYAANAGDVELARTLIRLGADPDIKDLRFDATPLGWARHADQEQLIALLEPITAPETLDGA